MLAEQTQVKDEFGNTIASDGRVISPSGAVAMKHDQPVTHLGIEKYTFITRANISLAWIQPSDTQRVLDATAGCKCGGGRKRQAYGYASQADVRQWTNNGGR